MTASAKRWDKLHPADQIPAEWLEILLALPGYDPRLTADGARFDPEAASAAVEFFPEYLRHIEGDMAGKPFVLGLWQKGWVANLFGWKKLNERGEIVRRYRESLLYVPRKNGKSPLAAGVALAVFCLDAERGQQDYLAAGEKDQAGMLFRHCKGMLEQSPELMDGVRIYGGSAGQMKNIVREGDHSFLKVISASAETKHGGNTHLALVDELHVQKDRELIDVLTTSFASANRKQPLFLMLTTADYDRPSICNEKHGYACAVRDNPGDPNLPGYDPAFLPCIYEATSKDRWDDEAVWARVNPNLGVSVSLDYLRRECKKAKEQPALEYTFKRLHLNMKTGTAEKALDLALWDACPPMPTEEDLLGRECYGGLDLSTITDLTAFALAFPWDDDSIVLRLRFWMPKYNAEIRERRDRVPFRVWADQGLVTLTDGDEGKGIDYDRVKDDVLADCMKFNVRELAVDRWNAHQIMTQLAAEGLEIIGYGQGYKDMNAPTKELVKLAAAKKLRHGGNPVLRWQAGNLVIEKDPADNWKPNKAKAADRIDGMVAIIMALGRLLLNLQGGDILTII